MIRPKKECIDCKCFASLILDYEIPASSFEKAYVSCRVLIEDLFAGYIVAESRTAAIEKFRRHEWIER